MIALFIIPLLLIYLLRNAAGKCFAQREKCMNRASFNASVLSLDISKIEWRYPMFDLVEVKHLFPNFKGSSFLKEKYPENKAEWQRLASQNLPKVVYKLVNWLRPQYDPFSDHVHYMKFKEEVNSDMAIAIGFTGVLLCNSFIMFALYATACVLMHAFAFIFNFNRHLKKLTI